MSIGAGGKASPSHEGKPIRVLIADDSAMERRLLTAIFGKDPEFQVVGWAADGAEAVRAAAKLKPDVITMDLSMPVLDGLEATRRIMQEAPTPIVMVSSSGSPENQTLAFEALGAGVLAVLKKPEPGTDWAESVQELLRTVKGMARIKVVRRWARQGLQSPGPPATPPVVRHARQLELVAIGSSTGGPQALQEILSRLPATFSLPVLIVQHIAAGFTSGLVNWLGSQCALPIREVDSSLLMDRPGVYVAPAGQHMVVRGRSLALSGDPPVSGHRPSATVLLQTVARTFGPAAVGVLLTGMGDDGAAGLREVKKAGGVTIAQDEESSVVFGMPAAAIGMGVVDYILPPSSIGLLLMRLERRGRES